jgi:hypothetical protein
VNTAEGELSPRFEERVDVVDHVAESLRRAVFSQAESSLDVIEMLLALPILPMSVHDIAPCPLADRAKLRLLEDAMFDACEREGEDEIIGDLQISPATPDEKAEAGHKHHPKQQQQQISGSNKRTKRK